MLLFALLVLSGLVFAYAPQSAIVYKNEACGHCTSYISSLYQTLDSIGVKQIEIKDFLSDQEARGDVASIQDKFKVPVELQGHLLTVVDGKYLFEGHFPLELMKKFLVDEAQDFDSLVVTQDSMGDVDSYFHLKDGVIQECPISQPISECDSHAGKSVAGLDVLKVKFDSNALVLALLGVALVVLVLLYSGVIK